MGAWAALLASPSHVEWASIGALVQRDNGIEEQSAGRKRPSEIPLMQDWILILAPVSLVSYFLMYPSQFHQFITWFGHLIR